MTSLCLASIFLTILSGCTTTAAYTLNPVDCKKETLALIQSLHIELDPAATVDTPKDAKPETVQMLIIKGLPRDKSRVSADGQVIYISAESFNDASDSVFGAELFARAVDQQVALRFGDVCPPTEIPRDGT